MGLEVVISKLIFNKAIQKKKTNRVCIYVAIFLVFLAAQYFAIHRLGVSLLDYVQEEFAYVVALPILGLIVNMIIRGFQIRKIRKLYGDGSEGFVFDLKKEDIVETNRQNQAVEGKYNADIAVKTRTGIFVGEKYKKTIAGLAAALALCKKQRPESEKNRRLKADYPLISHQSTGSAKHKQNHSFTPSHHFRRTSYSSS